MSKRDPEDLMMVATLVAAGAMVAAFLIGLVLAVIRDHREKAAMLDCISRGGAVEGSGAYWRCSIGAERAP